MKKIRLDPETYLLPDHPCHITICSHHKLNLFENHLFTLKCMDILEKESNHYRCILYVYCFMPDHLHLITSSDGTHSIIDLIRAFKSKATLLSYSYGHEGKIFQSRFFDRFVRKEKGFNEEILYILNNPVRKGFVGDFHLYPYCKNSLGL
jgi:putative transposase